MSCFSRRDFLKFLGYSILMSQVPYSPFVRKANASINPLDWLNLIDINCVTCDVTLAGCVKLEGIPPKVKIAPKISYWIPEGFIESGLALEIGKTLPLGDIINDLIQPIKSILTPFLPTGTKSYEIFSSQQYMKLYPHWFGFPPPLVSLLKTTIMALNSLNPICLSCNLADSIASHLVPVKRVFDKVNEQLGEISEGLEKIEKFKDKLNQLMNPFQGLNQIIPAFLSEILFFIWIIPEFSPDNYTIAPLFDALHEFITTTSPAVGSIICPTLTQHLSKFDLPFGIEPSFLCVGRWGYGYPRVGVVRHDDPIVAGLLSIARFHHLFTKTIPLIKPKFSFDKIKYQLYSPYKSSCFKIGYYASDPLAKAMFKIEDAVTHFSDFLSSQKLKQAGTEVASQMKEKVSQAMNNVIHPTSLRNVGVVIWKEHKKCCW